MVGPVQLDVELVKVEVVVMTEDEQEDVQETVIGQAVMAVEQEASNESSAVGGDECSDTPVVLEVDRSETSTVLSPVEFYSLTGYNQTVS